MTDKSLELARLIATSIWLTYDNSYGYASEKIARVDREDILGILGMFDNDNLEYFLDVLNVVKPSDAKDKLLKIYHNA